MKLLKLHPDDAQWLRRWIRSNLVCVLVILCFLIAIRNQSPESCTTSGLAQAGQLPVQPAYGETDRPEEVLPPETKLVLLDSRRPNPVLPEGWRRTKHGWEHVSTWRIPRPLGQIIANQLDREPVWARNILAGLRSVPPLMFALIQITAIAAIINASRNRTAVLDCLEPDSV